MIAGRMKVIVLCFCFYLGEGFVAFYATPNPFQLNKICLNQQLLGTLMAGLLDTFITANGHTYGRSTGYVYNSYWAHLW